MFVLFEKNTEENEVCVRERHFHWWARDREVAREPESGCRALLPCPMAHARRQARAVSCARATAARTAKSFPELLEEIQRKPRVREWTPQNAPRIRTGVTKKDQKAELKKNQTRRCYAEKNSIFSQTTGRHPPGARRETTEVKTRNC